MNPPKSTIRPAELAMPSRLEGLLSLLVASPMTLLGCTPDEPPTDGEGSSTDPVGSSSGSTGVADSSSTSVATTGDDTQGSTGSSSTTEPIVPGTTDPSTSSGPPSDSTSSSGGESTSTGGEQGNTCERVGDLMDMCFGGGYGYYYESSCDYYINYWIAAGDLACAQAYNEVYACIADLECAEVFMGVYSACEVQYDNMNAVCYDWGDTFGGTFGDSGVFEDSGVGFIVPETDGFGSATSDGGWGGWTSTDGGGFGST